MTSMLDRLGIGKDRRKADPTRGMNYTQKQEYLRAQEKKRQIELDERTAKIGKVPPAERDCPVCEKPMQVAVGQLMFCHTACKGQYKRAMRKAIKRKS